MLTKFGKITLIFFIFFILIVALFIFLNCNDTVKADFTFSIHDENGEAYCLLLDNRPSGTYYLTCTSGYGYILIDGHRYNLRKENIKIHYSNSFLNNYYTKGTVYINKTDIINIVAECTGEPFTIKFKYTGE